MTISRNPPLPAPSPLEDPKFDMTVRVGCSLTYEVTGTLQGFDRFSASYSTLTVHNRFHFRIDFSHPADNMTERN